MTVDVVLHLLFNPGPLTIIIDTQGHLMDPYTWIQTDPTTPWIARLLRRGWLYDCGAIPGQ